MKTTVKKHRMFFALMPDDEIASHIAALAHHVAPMKGSRVIPLDNLHMTLAFVGRVTTPQLERLITCGQKVSERFLSWRGETQRLLPETEGAQNDFSVRLDRLGFWPQGGIVWAGSRLPAAVKGAGAFSAGQLPYESTGSRIFSDALMMHKALQAGALPWVLADQLKMALAMEGLFAQADNTSANASPTALVPHVTLARGVRCASLPRLGAPLRWSAHEFVLLESVTQGMQTCYQVCGRFPLNDAYSEDDHACGGCC